MQAQPRAARVHSRAQTLAASHLLELHPSANYSGGPQKCTVAHRRSLPHNPPSCTQVQPQRRAARVHSVAQTLPKPHTPFSCTQARSTAAGRTSTRSHTGARRPTAPSAAPMCSHSSGPHEYTVAYRRSLPHRPSAAPMCSYRGGPHEYTVAHRRSPPHRPLSCTHAQTTAAGHTSTRSRTGARWPAARPARRAARRGGAPAPAARLLRC